MPFGIDSWGIGCLFYQIFQRDEFERSNQLLQATKIPNVKSKISFLIFFHQEFTTSL